MKRKILMFLSITFCFFVFSNLNTRAYEGTNVEVEPRWNVCPAGWEYSETTGTKIKHVTLDYTVNNKTSLVQDTSRTRIIRHYVESSVTAQADLNLIYGSVGISGTYTLGTDYTEELSDDWKVPPYTKLQIIAGYYTYSTKGYIQYRNEDCSVSNKRYTVTEYDLVEEYVDLIPTPLN